MTSNDPPEHRLVDSEVVTGGLRSRTIEQTVKPLLEGHGFYLDIFPLKDIPKIRQNDLIPIATRVRYTHLAVVVRWKRDYKLWRLTEPRQDWYPPMNEGEETDDILSLDAPKDFWSTPLDRVNKSVVVWRQLGNAYVFGFVKRGIGKSEPSSYSPSSYFGEGEYEPGFFEAHAYVPLYALKAHLQGVDFFFAPMQAVEVL